ncbi:class I fructose-bisphosphate aldolase [Metallibacterium sp.]|uniref:class I fructose-bisphosphate aldolase n=1 Tax=Metallibacterium sp. TaxID=2940281 RepID=UPI002620810A|nr:class I fructose-bisphosphate aldolase [Metallibacterium sp.]
MSIEQLESIAQAMVAPGKGIIAIDESSGTIKKRFDVVGIDNSEENRRAYRELLLTAPGLADHISGAILYDETLRQSTRAGKPFTEVMHAAGILPGIKVDMGPQPLAGFPGEVVTEGLDGLRQRLAEYARLGARFAKWRAVIHIGEDTPSSTCIEANNHALARYAALCQEAGLVPVVEPEVLMDGDHDIDVCYEVTEAVLRSLFASLYEHNVMLEGSILKASMVIAGKDCDEQATAHLNAMNQLGPHPWPLSFSYGRAMQQAALKLWAKDMQGNFAAAQKTVAQRARANGLAALGQWTRGT